MASPPRDFIMPNVASADLQSVLQELKEESLFDVIKQTQNPDGTWSITVHRRTAQAGSQQATNQSASAQTPPVD
jgi:hypothetical protein